MFFGNMTMFNVLSVMIHHWTSPSWKVLLLWIFPVCTVERTFGVKPIRRKPDGHVLNQAAEAMTWSGQCKVCCLLQIVSVSILRPYASHSCNVTSAIIPSITGQPRSQGLSCSNPTGVRAGRWESLVTRLITGIAANYDWCLFFVFFFV